MKKKQVRNKNPKNILADIFELLQKKKKADPTTSYTALLYQRGKDKINQKIMEEAFEFTQAKKKTGIKNEFCDLIYHAFVLLNYKNITYQEIEAEMARRANQSGLEEKKSRIKK